MYVLYEFFFVRTYASELLEIRCRVVYFQLQRYNPCRIDLPGATVYAWQGKIPCLTKRLLLLRTSYLYRKVFHCVIESEQQHE